MTAMERFDALLRIVVYLAKCRNGRRGLEGAAVSLSRRGGIVSYLVTPSIAPPREAGTKMGATPPQT
jgi:hypothetical protein